MFSSDSFSSSIFPHLWLDSLVAFVSRLFDLVSFIVFESSQIILFWVLENH